jgi:Surface-adhesin protein E
MKKLLLLLVLASVSTNVMAEWTVVGGENDSTSYVDLSTINKSESIVAMWVLEDLKTAKVDSGESYLSTNAQYGYDCNEEKFRTMAFFNMSENMGKGKVVNFFVSKSIEWKPIPPGSVTYTLWGIACMRHELIS